MVLIKSGERNACFWCNWPVAVSRFKDALRDDWFYTCAERDCRTQSINAVQRAAKIQGITLVLGSVELTGQAIAFDVDWNYLPSEMQQRVDAIETRRRWASRKK